MANEFRVRKKLIVNGSGSTILDVQGSQGQLFSVTDSLSGSLFSVKDISGIPVIEAFSDDTVNIGTFNAEAIKVSGSFARITGSLLGSASWANNATTSSYILNSVSASFASTASSADNLLVRGTLTAQTIVVQTITSSTDFVTGSSRFGSLSTNTHQFTGSVSISGSGATNALDVNGNIRSQSGISLINDSYFGDTAGPRIRVSGGLGLISCVYSALSLSGGSSVILANNSVTIGSTNAVITYASSLTANVEQTATLRANAMQYGVGEGRFVLQAMTNASGFGAIGNMYICGGRNTFNTNHGNVYLAADLSGAIGSVGVGTNSISASAILQVDSTTKGFLPPRLTTTQRDAIASPATGLQVYNSTTNTNDYYNGTSWASTATGNIYTADGTLTGNRTVTSGGNSLTFLGGIEPNLNEQTALILQTSATNKTVLELSLVNTFISTGKTWRLRSLSSGDFDIVTGISTRAIYISSAGNVAINNASAISGAQFSVNGSIATNSGLQIQGDIVTPLGAGIELNYSGGISYFTSYNRTVSAWLPIIIRGSQIDLFTNGSNRARITNTGRLLLGTTTEGPFLLDVSGSSRVAGNILATSGSDYFDISHDITQPAQTGSQIYEVNITPTLRYTAPNQTQTALRVAATFSGSTVLSSSQANIIADFGSTSAGSQFLVNDITSGSIYMVNDVSGLPIIEANSNWDVFIYDYPNVVLKKTGSTIEISGSLRLNGSSLDTAWTPYTPVWTAASTNPVIGNGTIEGYYKVVGKTCFVRGNIAMGSTTTFGSGEWYVSMPFTASHADAILITANLLDNGTAWYNATMNGARAGFNNRSAIQYQNTGGTASDTNATQPFTWTTSDRFIWNGSYEIA